MSFNFIFEECFCYDLTPDQKEAVKEMSHMTHLYEYATNIRYSESILLVADISLQAIECDFNIAKEEIETYFCKNFVTGDFKITQEDLPVTRA